MVFPEIKIPDESNYSADDWYVLIEDVPVFYCDAEGSLIQGSRVRFRLRRVRLVVRQRL